MVPQESAPLPLLLNHFYEVLDHPTYQAIAQSAFLRERFAASEQRTTVRTDQTYTGVYFYGQSTYFEFLDASTQSLGPAGSCAIAFGLEQPGAIRALPATFVPRPQPVTRLFQERQVPWFYMSEPVEPLQDDFRLWVMEYHPDFLTHWNPLDARRGIRRAAVLDRYAAVLHQTREDKLLRDVTEIHLELAPAPAARLLDFARSCGLPVSEEADGYCISGQGFTLRLSQSPAPRGIHAVQFSLTTSAPEQTLPLGNSTMRLGPGDQASWAFS